MIILPHLQQIKKLVSLLLRNYDNSKYNKKPTVSLPERVVQGQTQSKKSQPPTPNTKKPLVPESLTREFGLTAKTIVIDPGHGGKDPGALGRRTLREKDIVLSISEKTS